MGRTPPVWYRFREAVGRHQFARAAALLQEEPSLLRAVNSIGETVLHYLAVENDLDGVAWLHAQGADLNTRNSFGTPVLFEVALLGYKELFSWFVANDATVDLLDGEGQDLPSYLLDYDKPEMADWVARHGD